MKLPYVWDYDMDEDQFKAVLNGEITMGRLEKDWAATRLLEYATYPEIILLLEFSIIVSGWPIWRNKIQSPSRKRAFDFLVEWLSKNHPELI